MQSEESFDLELKVLKDSGAAFKQPWYLSNLITAQK